MLAAGLLLAAVPAPAQAPQILSHQGKLTVNGTNFTGTAQFKFALVNAPGNATFWSDNGTSAGGAAPSDPPIPLAVSRGIFSVNLGDLTVSNMTLAVSPNVFTNTGVFLRTWVNDGADGWQQLSPDVQMVSVGYALAAMSVSGNVPDAQLSTNIARLNGANAFTGTNRFAGVLTATNAGNLFSGTFTGNLSGNATTATSAISAASATTADSAATAATATAAISFSGPLSGDVTGTQGATVVAGVGGQSAANVAGGASAANGATSANTANTLVRRDGSGNFSGSTITANGGFIGNGSGLTGLNPANLGAGTAAINISGNAATATSVTGPIDASTLTGTLPAPVVQSSLPSGTTVVSMLAQDASLLNNGYQFLMTVPPPAWVSGSTTGAPSARIGQSALWDGQHMIVWGGNAGSGSPAYVNTGGLYDPVADQWTSISPIDVPEARSGHASVWTGSQMVIWGGVNNAGAFLNTGGRYQPSPQQWSTVSTSNAPASRSGHIAVWTGSAMFIWGGQNTNGLLNDGAFYDPVGDQWTTLTLANPPEARINATAVWTGSRVIVWGGTGAGGPLNDGGELVFTFGAPSQWVATTLAGAPAARSAHSAVWAGYQMIVWGGNNGGALGDGGIFTPALNSWAAVSTLNSPAARFNHAALWTGSEMLILDGSSGSGELASGSAYNPASGLWRTLSGSGSPLARTQPGAVWTGTQVVVFGGQASSQPVAALQTLFPQPAWYFYSKL